MSPNRKVNLSEVQIVKRGKPPYENEELAQDILNLDPTNPDDAFLWAEAVVNLNQNQKVVGNEKMKYRTRAESIAERLGVAIRINWTSEGEMVISLKS
jgi:hypothetical protein